MKYFPLVVILFLACSRGQQGSGKLVGSDLRAITLVGGGLVANMEDYAFFEYGLIQSFPQTNISLRNIGWPADDVFGLARSQFGSAQNTQSWQPPSKEEGFGSKVLMQHIENTNPKTLLIGYGSEMAFCKNEEEFELFKSGYKSLLDQVKGQVNKLILMSPHQQEFGFADQESIASRNDWLSKTSSFIEDVSNDYDATFVNLYDHLITSEDSSKLTFNGSTLNEKGQRKLVEILFEQLGIPSNSQFDVSLDKEAKILDSKKCTTGGWRKTSNGVRFGLQPNDMICGGTIKSIEPVAIYINGKLASNSQDTIARIKLEEDSKVHERIISTIKEKNQLYRYRIRPLNEAYIYLFRKHEMGHLAYEMNDLETLVKEKEMEINNLKKGLKYDIEIELIKPWKAPRLYPDDEVPSFIPVPNISEELEAFNIIDGYEMQLFAKDPMIANPININWDTKGRAWVATSSTYPHIVPGREPNDKIIILEDTDNDGVADKHTVFAENLLVPHSVMPVKGGAYVLATTQLLFLADNDGDDIADETRVVFDGFGNADIHHTIHGLRWMPWGDLHFTQSIYINSFIETAYGPRVLNGSGIWSLRPETEKLEIFSRGMINPWGETIDEWGQTFATDGAGSFGISYLFPESAHITAVGENRVLEGLNMGKPKYTSAEMVYSDHFPQQWQGSIITNDFRANRTVRYEIERENSGYKATETETILYSDHRSYRPVDAKIGPDGTLYIVDWYNPIIDHGEVDFHHPIRDKKHGRIWRLVKRGSPLSTVSDLSKVDERQLLALLKSDQQHIRLKANRAYVERNGDPEIVKRWLTSLSSREANFHRNRMEGLWLLSALNSFHKQTLLDASASPNPGERAAAMRLIRRYDVQEEFIDVIKRRVKDEHPQVRLEVLSTLRKYEHPVSAEIASVVLDHKMDENLHFSLKKTLEMLKEYWLDEFDEESFEGDLDRQTYALLTTEDREIIPYLNRILEQKGGDDELRKLAYEHLAKIGDGATKTHVIDKAIAENKPELLNIMANAPAEFEDVATDLNVLRKGIEHDSIDIRIQSLKLISRWSLKEYLPKIRKVLNNSNDPKELFEGYQALLKLGQEEEVIQSAKSKTSVEKAVAATSVWIREDPKAALSTTLSLLQSPLESKLVERIFNHFKRTENGPDILEEGLDGTTIPEANAIAGLKVLQTTGLPLASLEKALRKAGKISTLGMDLTREEKLDLIAKAESDANIYRGRQIYRRKELLCASCHQVYNEGGLSGPPLSSIGSFMTPNAILDAIINPSADIKQNYETMIITKSDGEVISGILDRKTASSTLLRQANNELIDIPAAEISKTEISASSMMPKGLVSNLSKDELKDLLAFLMSLGEN